VLNGVEITDLESLMDGQAEEATRSST